MSGPGGRATAVAPSNIAFVKYWGARDVGKAVPLNPSISMTLERCRTRSTVEVLPAGGADEVRLTDGEGRAVEAPASFVRPILAQLDRVRAWAGRADGLRVETANSFPRDAGIASSASGFAALTLAAARALGREDPPASLAGLVRAGGSGSAVRSLLGGYVEWSVEGDRDRLRSLAGAGHWDLRDLIAVVEERPKEVSSREGHRRIRSSPHLEARLEAIPARLEATRAAIADRDLGALGPVLEEEAVELHLVAMSSRPPIFYWTPGTLEVLAAVRGLRRDGARAWATMDAGANVHVICEPPSEAAVAARLEALGSVRRLIRDRVGAGPSFEGDGGAGG